MLQRLPFVVSFVLPFLVCEWRAVRRVLRITRMQFAEPLRTASCTKNQADCTATTETTHRPTSPSRRLVFYL